MDKAFLMIGLTCLVAGLMCIGAAGLNMEVFFMHPSAQPIVKALGRLGARAFYAILGVVFLLIGVFCTVRGLQLLGVLGGG
jgi:hypothetical protein